MRIYFDVKLSTPQETFLPTALFFAPEDFEDDNDIPSKDVVMLECINAESTPFDDVTGTEFSIRWKNVTMDTDKKYDEDFTLDELKEAIEGKRLCNMEAALDRDTQVKILGVTIHYMDEEYDITEDSIDEISFDGV